MSVVREGKVAATTQADRLGMDPAELRERIAGQLSELSWSRLLGKQRGGEQSLLEHSLAVLDVLLACEPFFGEQAKPPITRGELLGLVLACVAHDAGKQSPDFQAYLRGERQAFARHVDETAIREVVLRVAESLGAKDVAVEDVVSEAILHDRHQRRDKGELVEWGREHGSPRWRALADFVNHADSLASATDIASARLAFHPKLLGRARAASYEVRVRGVSTTFLHEAALAAFEAAGFSPILHLVSGTVFAGLGEPPSLDGLRSQLERRVEALFGARAEALTELAVGSPLANLLPYPEYVRRENVDQVLQAASRRVKAKAPPSSEQQQRAREKDEARWGEQWARQAEPPPTARDLQAIAEVGPEACVFKAGKYLLQEPFCIDQAQACQLYEEAFGPGTFEPFQSQGSYKPVEDYLRCVRGWHAQVLDGLRVGDLPSMERVKRLVGRLSPVVSRAIRTDGLPSERVVALWAETLIRDVSLATPADAAAAAEQLKAYSILKERSRRDPALCAQCACEIEPGKAAGASDALGNCGSFTNRLTAFDSRGSPPLCSACVVDIQLAQLSLAARPQALIALVPPRSLGPGGARELIRRARELRTQIVRELSPETADPTKYFALTFPPDALRAEDLHGAVVRPRTESSVKKRLAEFVKALEERLGDEGLQELNDEHGAGYEDVKSLASAVLEGSAEAAVRADGDVQQALAKATHSGRVDFACVTPNLIIISLDRAITADHAADAALFCVGLGALFAGELGMAAFVGPVGELRTALVSRRERSVYVPANGPVRRLVGGDWLSTREAARWLAAIRGAICLGPALSPWTPYRTLRAPSAGAVVRRLELEGSKNLLRSWPWIEALKEVLD